jgi:uncharacterized Zn-finger protein
VPHVRPTDEASLNYFRLTYLLPPFEALLATVFDMIFSEQRRLLCPSPDFPFWHIRKRQHPDIWLDMPFLSILLARNIFKSDAAYEHVFKMLVGHERAS